MRIAPAISFANWFIPLLQRGGNLVLPHSSVAQNTRIIIPSLYRTDLSLCAGARAPVRYDNVHPPRRGDERRAARGRIRRAKRVQTGRRERPDYRPRSFVNRNVNLARCESSTDCGRMQPGLSIRAEEPLCEGQSLCHITPSSAARTCPQSQPASPYSLVDEMVALARSARRCSTPTASAASDKGQRAQHRLPRRHEHGHRSDDASPSSARGGG